MERRDKADRSVNITAGYRATGVYPINHSVITDATFAPILLTYSEDAQASNVMTITETPSSALLSHQKNWKASPLPYTSGNVVSTKRNDGTLAYGTEECH